LLWILQSWLLWI